MKGDQIKRVGMRPAAASERRERTMKKLTKAILVPISYFVFIRINFMI